LSVSLIKSIFPLHASPVGVLRKIPVPLAHGEKSSPCFPVPTIFFAGVPVFNLFKYQITCAFASDIKILFPSI